MAKNAVYGFWYEVWGWTKHGTWAIRMLEYGWMRRSLEEAVWIMDPAGAMFVIDTFEKEWETLLCFWIEHMLRSLFLHSAGEAYRRVLHQFHKYDVENDEDVYVTTDHVIELSPYLCYIPGRHPLSMSVFAWTILIASLARNGHRHFFFVPVQMIQSSTPLPPVIWCQDMPKLYIFSTENIWMIKFITNPWNLGAQMHRRHNELLLYTQNNKNAKSHPELLGNENKVA